MKHTLLFSHTLIYTAVCAYVMFSGVCYALHFDFSGQLSAWSNESKSHGTWGNNSGLRFIPQISLKHNLTPDMFFDAELSLNGFASHDTENSTDGSDLDLYRLKLRFATAKTETRIGLQKISFGPAFLLRSLQWFDRLNPRDPQHLTDGVYALRFKYSSLNNANFWIWCLLGNDDPKEFDILPADPDKPEFGGRVQYPVPYGEVAATFHIREVDLTPFNLPDFTERRFSLDGRWDIEVGIWFESVLQQQKSVVLPFEWIKLVTLGMDYTFGIGRGLYVLGEHQMVVISDKPLTWEEGIYFSAFSMSYPIGFFDSLTAIGYYFWDQAKYAQYLNWERTYDDLKISISGFKYPETDENMLGLQRNAIGTGSGGQVMIIYNY